MVKSLKFQMFALALIPFFVISICGMVIQNQSLNGLRNASLELTESYLIDANKQRLKSMMETVESLIKPYAAMPGKSGLEDALTLLRTIKFDDNAGYIFAYDGRGSRVMIGSRTDEAINLGGNYWSLKDKKGNLFIQELIQKGKSGGGFVTYWFPRPNSDVAEPKYSYAIYVPEWDLMFGTGFYIEGLDEVISKIEQEATDAQVDAQLYSSGITLFLAIAVCVAAVIFLRLISNALNNFKHSVRALADGEGDLTKSIARSPITDFDEIAKDFNSFIALMAEDIRLLITVSDSLSAIANESVILQNKQVEATEKQKMDTLQASTAVEEMVSTSGEIANSAEVTREAASDTESQMSNVLIQVNQSSDILHELSEVLGNAENSVRELGSNVESINTALGVIQAISEQTNLLALNAAIEAARAGEQGRGFAVVADEVRTLAQRSQQSTVEIGDILERLQSSANRTSSDMHSSSEKRSVVVESMESITQLIHSASDSISKLSEMNVQVATAATEQSAVSDEIAKSVNVIADLADDLGKGSLETKEKFEKLTDIAKQLIDVSNKFTV